MPWFTSWRSPDLMRVRDRFGLGPFFCALGVLHFLETYLASSFLRHAAARHRNVAGLHHPFSPAS